MSTFQLVPHPDHPPKSVSYLDVQVVQWKAGTSFLYMVGAEGSALCLPPSAKPYRTDELWRSTCFELFVRTTGDAYLEFNFASSGQWAAYAFDGYRSGMCDLDIGTEAALVSPPSIWTETEGVRGYVLSAGIGLLPRDAVLAITAVIEETGGTKSYWALAHPPGAPDFHHPACFAARLPAPDAA